MDNTIKIGDKIKAVRMLMQLYVPTISNDLCIKPYTIYYIENNAHKNIYIIYLSYLHSMGVDLNILFSDINNLKDKLNKEKKKLPVKQFEIKINNINYIERNAEKSVQVRYLKYLFDKLVDLNKLFEDE